MIWLLTPSAIVFAALVFACIAAKLSDDAIDEMDDW